MGSYDVRICLLPHMPPSKDMRWWCVQFRCPNSVWTSITFQDEEGACKWHTFETAELRAKRVANDLEINYVGSYPEDV